MNPELANLILWYAHGDRWAEGIDARKGDADNETP